MILGVGVDICSVARIERLVRRYGQRFLDRVFTAQEQEQVCGRSATAERLAARFAAKEATMKALGTGWASGVQFLDIHVSNAPGGRPVISLVRGAAERAASMGVSQVHVSLSHERDQAIAFVVLEGKQEAGDPASASAQAPLVSGPQTRHAST